MDISSFILYEQKSKGAKLLPLKQSFFKKHLKLYWFIGMANNAKGICFSSEVPWSSVGLILKYM